jgi:hypothetical protein
MSPSDSSAATAAARTEALSSSSALTSGAKASGLMLLPSCSAA